MVGHLHHHRPFLVLLLVSVPEQTRGIRQWNGWCTLWFHVGFSLGLLNVGATLYMGAASENRNGKGPGHPSDNIRMPPVFRPLERE